MSGFWAGSIPQWGYLEGGCVAALCLLVGMVLGRGQGRRRAEVEAAEKRALRAQARWLERVRGTRGGTVMPPKSVPEHGPFFLDGLPLSSAGYIGPDDVPEVAHEQVRAAEGYRQCCETANGGAHQGTCPNSVMMSGEFRPWATEPPEVVPEWEPVHVGQALAVANPDPSVTAWTQELAERMNAWLAANVYGVPYSADELWSGQ